MLGGHAAGAACMSGFDFGLDRLVIGLFTGLTYGLLAVGLVLVYRSSRFVNFAHGSVGAFGASMLALFVADWGAPYWVAFVVAILVAAAALGPDRGRRRTPPRGPAEPGRHDRDAGPVPADPGHVAADQQRRRQRLHVPAGRRTCRPSRSSRCRSARRTSRCCVLAPVLLAGLGWFLRHHRMGIAIRAAADDPDTARLEGIPARWMATLAWAIAGGIAAFSAILVTPTTAGAGMEGLGPDLLLKGLAGAVIARMSSIPIAIGGVARHRRHRAAAALEPRHPRPRDRRDRADHRGRAAAPAAARPLRPGQGPLAPRRAAAAARGLPQRAQHPLAPAGLRRASASSSRSAWRTSSATTPRRCSPWSPATRSSASASAC